MDAQGILHEVAPGYEQGAFLPTSPIKPLAQNMRLNFSCTLMLKQTRTSMRQYASLLPVNPDHVKGLCHV